jgi:hypothetical protein
MRELQLGDRVFEKKQAWRASYNERVNTHKTGGFEGTVIAIGSKVSVQFLSDGAVYDYSKKEAESKSLRANKIIEPQAPVESSKWAEKFRDARGEIGVRAIKKLNTHTLIDIYPGRVYTSREHIALRKRGLTSDKYALDLPRLNPDGFLDYAANVVDPGVGKGLDADFQDALGPFLNEPGVGSQANCYWVLDVVDPQNIIVKIMTYKPVKKGEELTICYGGNYKRNYATSCLNDEQHARGYIRRKGDAPKQVPDIKWTGTRWETIRNLSGSSGSSTRESTPVSVQQPPSTSSLIGRSQQAVSESSLQAPVSSSSSLKRTAAANTLFQFQQQPRRSRRRTMPPSSPVSDPTRLMMLANHINHPIPHGFRLQTENSLARVIQNTNRIPTMSPAVSNHHNRHGSIVINHHRHKNIVLSPNRSAVSNHRSVNNNNGGGPSGQSKMVNVSREHHFDGVVFHPRCQSRKYVFEALVNNYLEIKARRNSVKIKGPGLGPVWGTMWALQQKANNPDLSMDKAVELAKQAAGQYTGTKQKALEELTPKRIRNHMKLLGNGVNHGTEKNPQYPKRILAPDGQPLVWSRLCEYQWKKA